MSETSGSSIRGARSLDGALLAFELEDVLGDLDDETTQRDEPRTSMTIVHRPDLRVVVSRLRDGATIGDERSDADVAIVAIDGTARLDVAGRTRMLRRGSLASIGSGSDWTLRGTDEAVAVLVFGAPGANGRTEAGREAGTIAGRRGETSGPGAPGDEGAAR